MGDRWRSGLVLLLSVVLLGVVVALGPGDETAAFRRVIGLGADRLADPADVGPGGTYAFLQTQPLRDDEPVTWDPCVPIRFEVNPAGAAGDDDAAVAFVQDGVAEVESISGLRFEYVGTTDRRPEWAGQFVPVGGNEPVLFAWATADEVEELEGSVAGVGGAGGTGPEGGPLHYVTGGVTLDADAFDRLGDDLDDSPVARAILLHEIGHLVGLGHVDSPAELMYGEEVGLTDFAQGDRNGLVRVGSGECR